MGIGRRTSGIAWSAGAATGRLEQTIDRARRPELLSRRRRSLRVLTCEGGDRRFGAGGAHKQPGTHDLSLDGNSVFLMIFFKFVNTTARLSVKRNYVSEEEREAEKQKLDVGNVRASTSCSILCLVGSQR